MNKEQNVNYTYNIIKKNIKIFRKEKKITQEKLAELINISSDYMNEIESYRKEKRFSIRILCDISLTLNIPIYLFFKDNNSFTSLERSLYMSEDEKRIINHIRINIKNTRENKGISINNLSKITNIRKDYLYKIEDLAQNISLDIYKLYKIALALDVKLNDLIK